MTSPTRLAIKNTPKTKQPKVRVSIVSSNFGTLDALEAEKSDFKAKENEA